MVMRDLTYGIKFFFYIFTFNQTIWHRRRQIKHVKCYVMKSYNILEKYLEEEKVAKQKEED